MISNGYGIRLRTPTPLFCCESAAKSRLVVTRPPPGAGQSSPVSGIMQRKKGDLMFVIIARAASDRMLKCGERDVNLFIILGVTVPIWTSPDAGW